MKFLKDFSITTFTSLLITLIAFLNNVIVTRQIGPEGRGIYAIVSNTVVLLALLLGEGIRKSNTLLASKNPQSVSFLFKQTILYSIIILIAFSSSFFFPEIWSFLLPNIGERIFLLTLGITFATILWQSFQAIFLGLNKIGSYNIVQFLAPFCFFLVNAIGIYFYNFGLLEIVISMLIGAGISLTYALTVMRKFVFKGSNSQLRKQSSSLITKSTLSALEFFIIFRGDIFLVNFFLGPAEAGIYAIAVIFSELLQRFPNVAGPLLVSKSTRDGAIQSVSYTTQLFRVMLLFTVISTIIIIVFGKQIIILLFGSDFSFSYTVLLYLVPALIFFGPASILYSYFISREYPPFVLIINGTIAIINFTANLIFIPLYGIISAAIISSISYFLWFGLYLTFFKYDTKSKLKELILVQQKDIKYFYNFLTSVSRKKKKN